MTLFGVDVSEFQSGMSLRKAAAEGISFAIVRTTDGTHRDRTYRSHVEDAKAAGLQLAAYHYLRNPSEGRTLAQQVAASVEVMGEHRLPLWLDCETQAGLTGDIIRQAKAEFEKAGIRVLGIYSYVPYWEGMRGGEPKTHDLGKVWVAAHGADQAGPPAQIYRGDDSRQWAYPLGGQKPSLWQFGSKAQVAGYSVDVNAFRGSVDDLKALFAGASTPASEAAETPSDYQKVLDYPRDQVRQDTYYNCGPATTQTIVRAATGELVPESTLAAEMGTTTRGTDYIGLITRVLRQRLPQADYQTVTMPNDPPTPAQREKLWADIVSSINAGYGVACNIVAPPRNYPLGVYGSVSPAYRGGTIYHYVAVMGYRDGAEGKAVWIADSGFSPFGYWVSLDQLATLIPPKGYAYAAAPTRKQEVSMSTHDDARLSLDQLAGPARATDGLPTFTGWPQLGDRTMVDALAAIGEKLGVPGMFDTKKGKQR